ncbi:class A beta-lactamase-related serine hydrolase [Blautia wexlerae]|nr:class A beta-lactamase-related serine hydrolase [Blautia wexlerae]
MEQVKADEAKKLNTADTKTVDVKLNDLLWNMITVSDNESCNELVKLQTDSLDFKKGAEDINKYLEKRAIQRQVCATHPPSRKASAQESLGGRNMTSVKDCGTLLEKNLQGGMCQQRCIRRNVKSSVKSGKTPGRSPRDFRME